MDHASHRLGQQHPANRLLEQARRLDAASLALTRGINRKLTEQQTRLGNLARTLHAVSPLETIARGYSVITAAETGSVISSTNQVNPDDRISAQVKDGFLDCTVDSIRKN